MGSFGTYQMCFWWYSIMDKNLNIYCHKPLHNTVYTDLLAKKNLNFSLTLTVFVTFLLSLCVFAIHQREDRDCEICERLHESKAAKSQLSTYWQMKWTLATCVLLSWAPVNLQRRSLSVCHGLQVCEDMQLLSFHCFPSIGCGNSAGTLCPQLRKRMKMVH